jgi:hypothetical protein
VACVSYKPIPGVESGHTALSIYPPGEMHSNDYTIAVGGCGVVRCKTFRIAKALLLDHAKRYCQRQIGYAKATLQHYEHQLAALERDGLKDAK